MLYGNRLVVNVTPTISTSIYAAGDVVGGLMTFPVATAGGGGVINQIVITDDDNEKAQATLYIFDAPPTSIADNAAFAPVIADLKLLVAVIAVASADFTTINSNAYAVKAGINQTYKGSSLYMYCVCTATPTYTAITDLTFRLTVSAD